MRSAKEIEKRLECFISIAKEKYNTSSICEIPDEGLRMSIYELKWVLDLIG